MDADDVNRTAKMFADSAEVESIEAAHAMLDTFVLQVHVGRGVTGNASRQAAVLTIVNAAARSFLGGVFVQIVEDPVFVTGWHRGVELSVGVQRHGGVLVDSLNPDYPTICVGEPDTKVVGSPVLRATFDGWTAGVIDGARSPLAERDFFVPAGIAAGGIAVAEAFEFRRGRNLYAGRRHQGISLWRPEADWLSAEAVGPDDVTNMPSLWWLIGLGHLGQGYLWNIGMLPYVAPEEVYVMLQDDDRITKANESTGLLTDPGWIGRRKTRALATVLEERGFTTAISERRFEPGHGPTGDEPRLALVGVDNPATRSELSGSGFEFVVDAGLGGGPIEYLDMQTHTFPSGRPSGDVAAWQQGRARDDALLDQPAYRRMTEETGDQCGTIEVAGRSVAAAFVGATAGALVVAEATRALLGEHRYEVIDGSLRNLLSVRTAEVAGASDIANTGFAPVHRT